MISSPSVNNNIDSVYERNRNNPYDLFHAMFVYIEVAYEANSLEFARLKEIFDSLLQKDNLFNIWRHIFSISNSANILTHSHTLLNGYRILSNLFEGQVGEILPSSALYYQAISSSLLLFGIELIKDDSSSGSSAAYLHLLSRLPRECLIFFIQNLISIDVEGSLDSLLPLLSNEFSQEAAEISLRLISKLSSSLTYSNITIKYLIHRTCSSISVESFVQSFCVLRTFSDSAAEILIDSLPTHTVAPFCFALSQVWADIGLVVKGTGRARGYLTALLLRTLPKLSKEELTSVGHTSTRTPILVVLSAGIGVYFDAADHGTRLLGMRVASQFAARLGTPLRFPELEEEERRLNVDLAVAAGDTELNGAKSSAVDAIAVEEKDEGEGGDDGDGDNDSELDAYLDEEEEPLQMSGTPSFPRVYYLSNCLQSEYISSLPLFHSVPYCLYCTVHCSVASSGVG